MKDDAFYAVKIQAKLDDLEVKHKNNLYIIYEENGENRIAYGSGNAGAEMFFMRECNLNPTETLRLLIKNIIRPDETDEQEIVRAIEVFTGTTNTLCDSEEIYVGVAFEWKYAKKRKVEYWVVHTDGSCYDITKEEFDAYVEQLKLEEEENKGDK